MPAIKLFLFEFTRKLLAETLEIGLALFRIMVPIIIAGLFIRPQK